MLLLMVISLGVFADRATSLQLLGEVADIYTAMARWTICSSSWYKYNAGVK